MQKLKLIRIDLKYYHVAVEHLLEGWRGQLLNLVGEIAVFSSLFWPAERVPLWPIQQVVIARHLHIESF